MVGSKIKSTNCPFDSSMLNVVEFVSSTSPFLEGSAMDIYESFARLSRKKGGGGVNNLPAFHSYHSSIPRLEAEGELSIMDRCDLCSVYNVSLTSFLFVHHMLYFASKAWSTAICVPA